MKTDALPPAHPATTPRGNADYRWTVKKVTAFLRALAACGMVAQAAREVGMSRQAAYALKARLAHPQFQDMWATALKAGRAARALRRQPASPWGRAGLAGLAHLRAVGPAGQADTLGSQADTLRSRADTLARKVTF